ncbi:MAG: response regulator [Bacteriovoracaceae bacterium]|nr:response regulator [Bacteriovoracaceae bacterium]
MPEKGWLLNYKQQTMFPRDTKILFVDDSESMRLRIEADLKELGFNNLTSASDGDEALELLKQANADNDPFALLLTDIQMDRMNGLKLLEEVRAEEGLKSLPVIMVSSESEKAIILDAIRKGANGYVFKPFRKQYLEEKLAEVFSKLS